MKKLIVLFCVMAVVITLAVPCFASSSESYKYFKWNEKFQGNYLAEGNYYFAFVNDGEEYAYIQSHHYSADHYVMMYCYQQGVGVFVYDSEEGGWLDEKYRTVEFKNPEVFDEQAVGLMKMFGSFVKPPIASKDFVNVYQKFTEQLTVKNIVLLLVVLATSVVGFVFMWWGVRKLTRALMIAFKKGKISL